MSFEFATAGRIVFGRGTRNQAAGAIVALGRRTLLLTGARGRDKHWLADEIRRAGGECLVRQVEGEPTAESAGALVAAARELGADVLAGIGGGSVLDAAKAVAALATNPGDPLDYLEVVGRGLPLGQAPLPVVALPTTAGTGSEATRNAVLAVPAHRVKVSLRSPLMLPRLAIVDSELTWSMPPETTAATGMDALTQLIEPYVSIRANPVTDGFCREGIMRAARSLRTAYEHGDDAAARDDMALAGLLGGLALANAGLGVVHGFAAPIGGMFPAPHGAVCARLLAPVMRANISALRQRQPDAAALGRYEEIAGMLTADKHARPEDGADWVDRLCADLRIPSLGTYGITDADVPSIVEKTLVASSSKANPLLLTEAELAEALTSAL